VSPETPAPPGDAAEAAAWEALRSRWEDEAAHRAFLDRFRDLPGLARAGARYREVLEGRPDDGPAGRGRDEVLRRATALALAAAPRPVRAPVPSPWVKRGLLAALVLLLVGGAGAVILAFLRPGAPR
jgi:hypothetical protein